MADTYDLIVLGSGPGGYVGAIRAAQLGLKVAIVERERLGGICLNWGCIPTKALLRSSEIYHYMSNAASYGLTVEKAGVDLAAVVKRSRGVADQLNNGVKGLMKKHKITVYEGVGKLTAKGKLTVTGDKPAELEAPHIILATGARARELPFAKADGERIWTYRHAMTPKEMPTKLLVIGSGAIGCEFASFYSDMGAEVTIVEMLDQMLPVEDHEVAAFVTKAFGKQGMKILTGTGVSKIDASKSGVKATIKAKDGKETVEDFSHVIVAVGIVPNIEGIGLDTLKIGQDQRNHIKVDSYGKTNVEGIWAIGDVVAGPWLAHKAMHEGVIAAEAIAAALGKYDGHLHENRTDNIAGCTYSRPQVASVGLTEKKAKEAGVEIKVGKFPFIGNGKAIALGEAEGFVKTIFDAKTGELIGAHMVGAEVTELIQGYVVGRQLETTEAELIGTIFPHPTLSEMMHESVLASEGRPLHI
ncbi:dihydrolipoyl dehydrogenase [Sphingomonas sp. ID0503]|uniref:dihydrolipoyl dehydrogenase n=1 Tax=Sphingomonas sp. ID0503 TaxID=3399691 RepID=UPI003AFA79C7